VTPDGYYVNADGVWVEDQPQMQPEAAAAAETAAQLSNARVAGAYQTVSISPEAAEPDLEPAFKGTVTIGVDTSNGFAMTFNNMPTKITEIYANEDSLDDDFDCPDPYLVWFNIIGREYCYGAVQADGTMDANFEGTHVFYKKVN